MARTLADVKFPVLVCPACTEVHSARFTVKGTCAGSQVMETAHDPKDMKLIEVVPVELVDPNYVLPKRPWWRDPWARGFLIGWFLNSVVALAVAYEF